jgi:hypothetical protein
MVAAMAEAGGRWGDVMLKDFGIKAIEAGILRF